MRFPKLVLLGALVSSFGLVSGILHGQSQPAAATPQPAASSASPPQSKAAPLPNAKPAKVWTNDEIDGLRNDHSVSVVGNRAPQHTSATTNVRSQEKDPAWYRKQLQPLEAEIAKLDGQIEKTKAFLNGEKVNDQPASYHAYVSLPGDPQEQLKQLEARREKDVEKVNDFLDLARHNDIPPGALR